MPSITLPEIPEGKEFEEYIAAYFNSAGFYVDRSLILRKEGAFSQTEILELDIHITDYRQDFHKMTLVEVKSGDWGMNEVFKIRGWMDLLNLQKGLFVTMKPPQELMPYEKVAEHLGIDLVPISDLSLTQKFLEAHLGDSELDPRDIATWRYSYWLEQALIEELKQRKKRDKAAKRHVALDKYLYEVNNGTFFCPSITDKADRLYTAFRRNPHITAKVSHEGNGESFDEEYSICTEESYKKTFFEAKYTDLQISMYVEHRARLAILKAAVDYCLYNKADEFDKIGGIVDEEGIQIPFEKLLPESFVSVIPEIQQEPYFHLYPIFWQWFLWVFGGFILKDYEEQEFLLLSQKTGIPISQLGKAFTFYDRLFPTPSGWLKEQKSSNIREINMFPVPFKGLGANYRRYYHCQKREFEELQLTSQNARKDIIKWNNLACEVLCNSYRYKK